MEEYVNNILKLSKLIILKVEMKEDERIIKYINIIFTSIIDSI